MKKVKLLQTICYKVIGIHAVIIPIQVAESAMYRKQLAENYGFKQIGERIPGDDATLKAVINFFLRKWINVMRYSIITEKNQC